MTLSSWAKTALWSATMSNVDRDARDLRRRRRARGRHWDGRDRRAAGADDAASRSATLVRIEVLEVLGRRRLTRTVSGAARSGTGPARNRSTLATARSNRLPAPSVSVAIAPTPTRATTSASPRAVTARRRRWGRLRRGALVMREGSRAAGDGALDVRRGASCDASAQPYPTEPEPADSASGGDTPSSLVAVVSLSLSLPLPLPGSGSAARSAVLRPSGAALARRCGRGGLRDRSGARAVPCRRQTGSSRRERRARPPPARHPRSGCRDVPVRGVAIGRRGAGAPETGAAGGGTAAGGGPVTATGRPRPPRPHGRPRNAEIATTAVTAFGSTGAPSAASASRSATASGYRSAGSVAIARAMTEARYGGMPSSVAGAAWLAARRRPGPSPSPPAPRSASRTGPPRAPRRPNAARSRRRPVAPAPRSGASRPSCSSAVRSSGGASISAAIPKSTRWTAPSSSTRMLAGLMSRWTIPWSWATASASATTAGDGDGLLRRQRTLGDALAQWSPRHEVHDQRRAHPGRRSGRAGARSPGDRPRAAPRLRARAGPARPGSATTCGWSCLIATISRVHSSRARQTVAIPPSRAGREACIGRRSVPGPSDECITPDGAAVRPPLAWGLSRPSQSPADDGPRGHVSA